MTIEIENNSNLKISSNKNHYYYNTLEIEKIYMNFYKRWAFSFKKYYLVIILKNGKKYKFNVERKHKEKIKNFVLDYNFILRKNKYSHLEI